MVLFLKMAQKFQYLQDFSNTKGYHTGMLHLGTLRTLVLWELHTSYSHLELLGSANLEASSFMVRSNHLDCLLSCTQ